MARLRFLYGTARDLVIGTRVVNADGIISKAGGRVVKNVAGYDLNKLYVGSLGTVGIIAELSFKLHPLPQAQGMLLASFASRRRRGRRDLVADAVAARPGRRSNCSTVAPPRACPVADRRTTPACCWSWPRSGSSRRSNAS